jgi:3-deoxy-7-phosphoheptulonate synthase
MAERLEDRNVSAVVPLVPPRAVKQKLPLGAEEAALVRATRGAIRDVLHGRDRKRLVVVVGPCSIHDPAAALDYARRLADVARATRDELVVVMRTYFEKPRTTVGWKGLINDPYLDGSCDVAAGLQLARQVLLDVNRLGVPCGSELLDPITPQYVADLVSWAAIGARTTESQIHRELASGLSCPVGFKNGTDGNVRIAADAVRSASHPHHFMAVTKGGRSAIAATSGNEDCHIILRGGAKPNYDAASVEAASAELARTGAAPGIMIDTSHANSNKKPENQPLVVADIARQLAGGEARIIGAMIESNLVAGRQDVVAGARLTYGQSITDGCIDWDTTAQALHDLADAVTARRDVRRHKLQTERSA